MTAAHPNATQEVLNYIATMPEFSRAICTKLRSIILKADKKIVEDWKWGPNYNYNGMICGYGAFKGHVKFTFFNGSAMKNSKQVVFHKLSLRVGLVIWDGKKISSIFPATA